VRTGQVTGGAHEGVIVENIKDSGYRLHHIVVAQFGFGAAALARSFPAAPAVAEPASPPALTSIAVVVVIVTALLLATATATALGLLAPLAALLATAASLVTALVAA
jgi:hypothetical protein